LVLSEHGHSPVQITSIAGGYYVATENDAEHAGEAAQQSNARERELLQTR
jgi:hypothetical protein